MIVSTLNRNLSAENPTEPTRYMNKKKLGSKNNGFYHPRAAAPGFRNYHDNFLTNEAFHPLLKGFLQFPILVRFFRFHRVVRRMKWKSGPRSLTHPMTHFFSRQRQMASHGTTRCHTVAWSAPQHSGAHLRAQRSSIQPVRSQDTASSYRPGYKSQDAEQPGYRASTQPVQSQHRARIQRQYRASPEAGRTARIHSQDTQQGYTARLHNQYAASTQAVHNQTGTQPV